MPSRSYRLLVWPAALVAAGMAAAESATGTLSLVAAHAETPPPVRIVQRVPDPVRVSEPAPVTVNAVTVPTEARVSAEAISPPMVRIGPVGATLRGAAGNGAVALLHLKPGTPVDLLSTRNGWSKVDQEGLVGWLPDGALVSD